MVKFGRAFLFICTLPIVWGISFYCDNFFCNKQVNEVNQPSKGFFYTSGGKTFLIPVGGNYNTDECMEPPGHKLADAHTAAYSHGHCAGSAKRPLRDAVVADSAKDAVKLIKNSTGKIGSTYPQNAAQLSNNGCVDAMGYETFVVDSGRPKTCFSLIAFEVNKTEYSKQTEPENTDYEYEKKDTWTKEIRSGWLSLNSIPFEKFNGLAQFLMNGNMHSDPMSHDVTHDLVCAELFRPVQTQHNQIDDHCAVLTYPGRYYRLCCCYAGDSKRLCHVHTNAITQPKKSMRCLVGKYDSSDALSIHMLNNAELKSVREGAEYCTIRYTLDTTNDSLKFHYEQKYGKGKLPDDVKTGYRFTKYDNRYYCVWHNLTICPQLSKNILLPEYDITCYCQGHFCNREMFSEYIERVFNASLTPCSYSEPLVGMLQHGKPNCWNNADLWNLQSYTMAFSSIRTNHVRVIDIVDNIMRAEFHIPNGCMAPNLPIRGFIIQQCGYADASSDCLSPKELLAKYAPDCPSVRPTVGTGLGDVDKFVSVERKAKSNTTFRCFAKAVFQKNADSQPIIVLSAGPVDNLKLNDMINCINDTIQEDCKIYQDNGLLSSTMWTCCHHSVDPRPALRVAIQSAVMPKTAEDIQLFMTNVTVCFKVWRSSASADSKCLTEADRHSEVDQQRFQYCLKQQNRRICSKRSAESETSAFCCCGETLADCEVDQSTWGTELNKFLTPQN